LDPEVDRAYAELEGFARPFGGWVRVRQVHGARVLRVEGSVAHVSGATLGEGDGLVESSRWTTVPVGHDAAGGLHDRRIGPPALLTVTVADCVPLFLAWPGGVGLLHAGWRGVAAGVLESGLAAASAPAAQVRLHLGPAIGGCCYEVGPEVVHALYDGRGECERGVAEGALVSGRGDRWLLDLRAALAGRALEAGVSPGAISSSSSCTACDLRFHSFRGSRAATVERVMLAFIGRAEGSAR
jgi:copper oxidase (laccase) domain-containing protein